MNSMAAAASRDPEGAQCPEVSKKSKLLLFWLAQKGKTLAHKTYNYMEAGDEGEGLRGAVTERSAGGRSRADGSNVELWEDRRDDGRGKGELETDARRMIRGCRKCFGCFRRCCVRFLRGFFSHGYRLNLDNWIWDGRKWGCQFIIRLLKSVDYRFQPSRILDRKSDRTIYMVISWPILAFSVYFIFWSSVCLVSCFLHEICAALLLRGYLVTRKCDYNNIV